MLKVIAGHDPADSTSVSEEIAPVEDYLGKLNEPVAGLRIGVASGFNAGADPAVQQAISRAVDGYREAGARIIEVAMPHLDYAIAAYYVIATAEASSNLARYDGVHYGYRTPNPADYVEVYSKSREEAFGKEVKRRIMLGTYALSSGYYDAYYLKALKVRNLIRGDFVRAFEQCDCIMMPVAPTTAFKRRREGRRPAEDVPVGHLHDRGQPGGHPRDQRPVRLRRRRHADRPANHRSGLQRSQAPANRPDARGPDGLAHEKTRGDRANSDMSDLTYKIIVGLEIHVQLSTRTKMFCGCALSFGEEANSRVCPVCLGLPGALPVMNGQAVEYAILAAMALNCEIAEFTKWDRKSYYYPDLPKNYQISQYDLPLGGAGLHRDPARRRQDQENPHPPGPSGGGRGQEPPHRRLPLAGGPQPRGHAAAGDRHRARSEQRRAGAGAGGRTAADRAVSRGFRGRHAERATCGSSRM